MRRSLLLTLAALGAIITAVGGTSLFAALADTARSGTNTAETGALAASADIRLASATQNPDLTKTCGAFSENLATPSFTAADVQPDHESPRQFFCVKNVGSQPVTVRGFVDGLTDVDFDCTGDESINGDSTCGGHQAGEASDALQTLWTSADCDGGDGSGAYIKLRDNQTNAFGVQRNVAGTLAPQIAPGETACVSVTLAYPTFGSFSATAQQRQQAQTDRATWHYRFDAQV